MCTEHLRGQLVSTQDRCVPRIETEQVYLGTRQEENKHIGSMRRSALSVGLGSHGVDRSVDGWLRALHVCLALVTTVTLEYWIRKQGDTCCSSAAVDHNTGNRPIVEGKCLSAQSPASFCLDY